MKKFALIFVFLLSFCVLFVQNPLSIQAYSAENAQTAFLSQASQTNENFASQTHLIENNFSSQTTQTVENNISFQATQVLEDFELQTNALMQDDAEQSELAFVVTANSAVVFENSDLSSTKVATLKHKDIVQVEAENGTAKVFGDTFKFYKLTNGYVLCDLLTKKISTIEILPNFNAKTNAASEVFLLENNTLVESGIVLKKGQEIFLYEGFDNKKEFTPVAFINEEDVIYGYLKTSTISPNGINPLIVSCAILILAVVGIVFALVLMKRKKIKLKKKKQAAYDLHN